MQDLKGFRVAVIASDGVEQIELTEPVRVLREAQAEVVLVGPEAGEIQGVSGHDKAGKIRIEQQLDEIDAEEFDGVVLPGGALNADFLRASDALKAFLRDMQDAGKPFAVICHAPWELISAGLVKGRTLTGYYTIQDDIRNAGGTWEDREVVEDGNWVTSRQPDDLPAFNEKMLGLFARARESRAEKRRPSSAGAEAGAPL